MSTTASQWQRGSLWRQWDLHIHTPASIVHRYPGADPWDEFLSGLANLPQTMSVLGINDYLFVDGYRRVVDEFKGGRLPNVEAVFPVVELRIDQLVGTASHLSKVNLHVIFPEQSDPELIEAQFINGLSASFHLDPDQPNDVDWSGFPTQDRLEALGAAIRESIPEEKKAEFSESDLELGFNNLVVSVRDVRTRLKDPVFKDNYVTAVGKAEWASMQWNDKSIAQKKDVINGADAVFISAESTVAYQAARASLVSAGVNGRLLDCSDAHWLASSDDKDRLGNSLTWINADPTLAGLRHALQEFDHRVFAGVEPPKLAALRNRPSDHMTAVKIGKGPTTRGEDHDFFESEVTLNPGFIAVIGRKGSGKSALLDAIGLAGNSANEPDFSFLSKARFRNPLGNYAQSYESSLHFHDGEVLTTGLNDRVDSDALERVTYIPQQLMDRICDPEPGLPAERFAQELGVVLFAHVSVADRLGTGDLESLTRVRSLAIEDRLTVLRGELTTINQEVSELERLLRDTRKRSLEARKVHLAEKLRAHEDDKPDDRAPPDIDKDPSLATARKTLKDLRAARERLDRERENQLTTATQAAAQLQGATQLKTAIETLQHQASTFRATYEDRAAALGLNIADLAHLAVDIVPLTDLIEDLNAKKAAAESQLDASVAETIAGQLASNAKALEAARNQLDQPSRDYEAYLKTVAEWEAARSRLTDGTEEEQGLKQVEAALNEFARLPGQISDFKEARNEKVRDIHSALADLVGIYEELYRPAREFIADHELASEAKLEFRAALRERNFEPRFWEMVGRNVAGSFMGVDQGAASLRRMIEETNFGDVDSVLSFAVELEKALHVDVRQEPPESVEVERAIRTGHSVVALYDLIFGLAYLEPFYQLQYSGTPIDQLSPGDRGTLLLMFYLLVDPSRRPLILDQPDENLDNQTVKNLLVPALKEASARRQVVVVTHNPNVAVVADADQVIMALFDGNRFSYIAGAIENQSMNQHVVDVLEGTWPAFQNRGSKYESGRGDRL